MKLNNREVIKKLNNITKSKLTVLSQYLVMNYI